MAQVKPIIHGRDHLPGGADPIPGMLTETSGAASMAIFRIAGGGSITVAAGSGGFPDLTYITGNAALVDLTAPATPAIVFAGDYTIAMTFSSTTPVWTVGATFQARIFAVISGLSEQPDQWGTVTYGAYDLPFGGYANPRQGYVALPAVFAAGETFGIELINNDSGSRDMTIDQLIVTRHS